VIGDVRGRGAMIAIELVVGGGDATPHPALAAAVAQSCHADGLLVMTTGSHRNSLRFLPPLTISDALLNEGLDVLQRAFVTAN
jgi:4-aminobutyrate aminotransferase/(S)-3-amino-2-methylpropionate transaminase